MHPYLLRSAVAVLRRPTPQGSAVLRRSVASGGALRVETKGCMVCVQDLEEITANLKQANKHMEFLLEHERRLERSEQRQKKLACVLVLPPLRSTSLGQRRRASRRWRGNQKSSLHVHVP